MQHLNKKILSYKKLYQLYNSDTVFVAFDTETTAISPSCGRIIEIGAVKFTKDGDIDTYSQLINPNTIIPPFITQLTNINQSMVNCQKCMEEYLPDFLDFINNTVLIAHNAQFDLNFLNAECEKCNYPVTKNKFIDTLDLTRWAYPTMGKYKLDFLADVMHIDKGSSHRAFDDAKTCQQIFLRVLKDTYDIQKH